ncbi:MAG: hypothetical protein QXU98_10355 [Candidatus Parvarchaeota archaeon]
MGFPFSARIGQGLPINTIILIAVGLLILVLMIVFVTGGFKSVGAATSSNTGLSDFQSECTTYCTDAGASYPYTWCTTHTVIGGTYYACSNATGPSTTCTVNLANGSTGVWGYSAPVNGNYCKLDSMS